MRRKKWLRDLELAKLESEPRLRFKSNSPPYEFTETIHGLLIVRALHTSKNRTRSISFEASQGLDVIHGGLSTAHAGRHYERQRDQIGRGKGVQLLI
jgi:hypothetical protein